MLEAVSGQAHNLEVGGSIPPSATNLRSIAQSGSASGLGPEGREFESLYSDQFCLDSSGVERLLYMERVRGSKPCPGTNLPR